MASAALTMEQAPFAVSERDGVTLIYDTPTRTVFTAKADHGRFSALLALAVAASLPLWLDGLYFLPGLYGALAITIAGTMAASHYAQLRVHEVRWWAALSPALWREGRLIGTALVAQWVAHAAQPVGGGLGLFGWAYWLLVSWLAIQLARRDALGIAETMGKEIKVLPRAIVATEALRMRRDRIVSDAAGLASLPVFAAAADDLLAAWQKKDTDAVERLLRAGDALNRQSWQVAIDQFNAAKDDIDLGRGRLRHLVKQADAALAAYAHLLDAQTERSGVLAGHMDVAALPPKHWTQKLDYGRGIGVAVGKAAVGQGAWQVSLAMVAFSGIMLAVNRQRLLRHLKELEGQVKAQAEAVRGDVGLVGELFATRLRPQFAAMLSLIANMETQMEHLHEAETYQDNDQAQADAYLLACSLREAKQVLEMKAGD